MNASTGSRTPSGSLQCALRSARRIWPCRQTTLHRCSTRNRKPSPVSSGVCGGAGSPSGRAALECKFTFARLCIIRPLVPSVEKSRQAVAIRVPAPRSCHREPGACFPTRCHFAPREGPACSLQTEQPVANQRIPRASERRTRRVTLSVIPTRRNAATQYVRTCRLQWQWRRAACLLIAPARLEREPALSRRESPRRRP